jgi:hypothetical protein
MTEIAKRVLGTLHKLASAPEPETPSAAEPSLAVEILLPDQLHAAFADGPVGALHQQLNGLLAELDLDRAAAITTGPTGSDTAAVSIDRRPLAYFAAGELPQPESADLLCDAILNRILRRLPLLAGPAIAPRSTAAYLLALGCRVPAKAAADTFDVDTAERLINDRRDEKIVIGVPACTMRHANQAGTRAFAEFRDTEFRKYGVIYPDARVVLTDDDHGAISLRLNDVTLPTRRLGADAGWVEVVDYVRTESTARRHWFVRTDQVTRAIEQDLCYVFPDLVEIAQANYSREQITAGLRELLRSGRRARNLPRILWLLIESGGPAAGEDIVHMSESPLLPKARHQPTAERDPVVQAVRIRKIAAEEDWRLGNYREPRHAVRLDPEIEERLVAAGDPDVRAHAEWAAVRAVAGAPETEHVVTRTVAALSGVRDALQAINSVPRVMTSHELPPDVDIGTLAVLADPAGSRA